MPCLKFFPTDHSEVKNKQIIFPFVEKHHSKPLAIKISGLSDSDWKKAPKSTKKKESGKLKKVTDTVKPKKKICLTKYLSKDDRSHPVKNIDEPYSLTEELSQFKSCPDTLSPLFNYSFGKEFSVSYERSLYSPDLHLVSKSTQSVQCPIQGLTSKRYLSSHDAQASPKKNKPSRILAPQKKHDDYD